MAAKAFRDERLPEVHAKLTRRWMWNHVWFPLMEGSRQTTNKLDDLGADYIYYEQACYIEDGYAPRLLREALAEVPVGSKPYNRIKDVLDLMGEKD
jgi:hypothetical protein